jgi:hypothetical protein
MIAIVMGNRVLGCFCGMEAVMFLCLMRFEGA